MPKNCYYLAEMKSGLKRDNPDFDVIMVSFDQAEVYELVGRYPLDILRKEFGDNKIRLMMA